MYVFRHALRAEYIYVCVYAPVIILPLTDTIGSWTAVELACAM